MRDLPIIKRYQADKAGPHVLVLGQVHGSEPCGRRAIETIIDDLEVGKKNLKSGTLTLVPCANPKAASSNLRYLEENLNRVFEPHDNPQSYEQHLANHLAPLFEDADYILDIHSTMAPTLPYVFAQNDDAELYQWISAMNVPYIVKGWDNIYPPDGSEMNTEGYAQRLGKLALTLECGQNNSKDADKMALRYLKRTLRYFDLMQYPKARYQGGSLTFNLEIMYRKEKEGHHCQPWKNFSGVKKGTALFQYEDGYIEYAPFDATIFLPKADAEIGWDWLYLARQEKNA